jgi:hypothetical protein
MGIKFVEIVFPTLTKKVVDSPLPAHWMRPAGRPLDKDRGKSIEAQKPWLALGMSRRTWYRQRAKAKK